MPTVLVAGGGTGGHIFPGIAIARELMERVARCEVLFVGTQRGLESRIVPAEGFRLLTIRSAGITGKRVLKRLKGLALIPISMIQSVALMARTRPSLVIGVGGYSSGPVLAAAVLWRVPTMIHEQNYLPGVTNRWLAPFVSRVVVAFPETARMLGGRGEALGNPVRKEFGLLGPRPAESPVTSILVFGGSQGARVINRAICDALPALSAMKGKLKVTHQTGEADLRTVTAAYRASGIDADVRPFISGMSKAFDDADLIVGRSGATTVAELTAAGRPAVLIPFAAAAHDHQTHNARKLSDAGAAVLMAEKDLSGASLSRVILELAADRKRLARMAEASRALGKPEAAGRIAEVGADLMAAAAGRVRR